MNLLFGLDPYGFGQGQNHTADSSNFEWALLDGFPLRSWKKTASESTGFDQGSAVPTDLSDRKMPS